jgi:hypothetical protein
VLLTDAVEQGLDEVSKGHGRKSESGKLKAEMGGAEKLRVES